MTGRKNPRQTDGTPIADSAAGRAAGAAPNALRRYGEIEHALAGRRAAVFLDYDGTLTPIVARPDLALLSDEMREAVHRLAGAATVAVISGRDRADVHRLVGLDGLVYAGSHGFDIEEPGGLTLKHEEGAAIEATVQQAAAKLRNALASIEGALVEPKRFAIAVHYRQVEDGNVPAVESVVDDLLKRTPSLRKTHGKKVFELRPQLDWDKGKAVLWLLEVLGLNAPDVLPFYLGDDTTDEDAFAALKERGIGIFVGSPPDQTAARYRLDGPEEVGRFMQRLAETLATRRDG
jgi:alpha,alpha-trehalase